MSGTDKPWQGRGGVTKQDDQNTASSNSKNKDAELKLDKKNLGHADTRGIESPTNEGKMPPRNEVEMKIKLQGVSWTPEKKEAKK